MKNIVQTQHRNEDRAVFGRGPFRVKNEFEYLAVDDLSFGRLTHKQKLRKPSGYLMTGMDGKEDVILEETANRTETRSTSALASLREKVELLLSP